MAVHLGDHTVRHGMFILVGGYDYGGVKGMMCVFKRRLMGR